MWQVDGGKSLKKNTSSSSGTQAASENALGTPWPRSELHVQSVQRTDKMSEARTLKSVSFLLFSNHYSVCVCRSVLQVRCVYIYISIYIYKYIYIYIYICVCISQARAQCFTSLPLRRLRWSAGAARRGCPYRVPAPHLGSVTSRTPQKFGVRVALPGRRLLAGEGSADCHSC